MSDIRLDDRQDGQAESWLTIETNILNVQGSDCPVSLNNFAGALGASLLLRPGVHLTKPGRTKMIAISGHGGRQPRLALRAGGA